MDSYFINVTRPWGTETTVLSARIDDAYFVPAWQPSVRNYTAYLAISQDVVRLTFVRLDNGQLTSLVSEPEVPSIAAGRRLRTSRDWKPEVPPSRWNFIWEWIPRRSVWEWAARRLQTGVGSADIAQVGDSSAASIESGIGEVQHTPTTLVTTLDVGEERAVHLMVTSADQSASNQYTFKVKRPACPQERRFFDGTAKVCTDICNEGFFGNSETGRCSKCIEPYCAVCDSGSTCTECMEGYTLHGGQCAEGDTAAAFKVIDDVGDSIEHYERKHWLVVIGAVGAIACGMCACIVLACCVVRGPRKRHLFDSDDEEFTSRDYYETEVAMD